MNEGLTWLFLGDFFEPLKASDWTNQFSTQTNPEELDRSNNAIVVATFYANPATTWDMRESVRRQFQQAQRLISEKPNWVIARNAIEAGRAINQGKKVLILALEGAAGILETEEDLKEFIDEKGIAIVTPLHFSDDRYGGPAFLEGLKAWVNPLARARILWRTLRGEAPHQHDPSCEGVVVNDRGLTEEGKQFIEKLIARRVWVDLSHASDLATRDLLPLLKKAQQPLLYTHTALRRYQKNERTLPDWMIPEIRKSGGYIGLMPSLHMLHGTAPRKEDCRFACEPSADTCEKGLPSLARQYRELVQEIGVSSIGFGSDWQGGVNHLPPTCGTESSLDQNEGFWKISQTPEAWDALQRLTLKNPAPRNFQVQRFLSAWEQVRNAD
jgi:microsomal dipeptidase-like Zn-dependent dipeptidase